MDKAKVVQWLQNYLEAWKTYDETRIADLFSVDATYRYHPYDAPVRGQKAIVDSWLEDPDTPGTYEGRYEPIAVDGDIAVVVGSSTYRQENETEEKIFDNCFVLRFDDDGRCSEFTEWYMERP
jgi:SnoaL-like domain